MLPTHASVLVAGGGPAGFMAAITAAEDGVADVVLVEATAEPLHKVLISGGGRCNVTHACWDPTELVTHYPRGGRALLGPVSRFAPGDAVAWFEAHGLDLVVEADGRMFPTSHRSLSVIDTLRHAAEAAGVRLVTQQSLRSAEVLEGGFGLHFRSGATLRCHRLVLATGSHPSGLRVAAALGHRLVPPAPSLFTLALEDHPLRALAGVAMDPVELELLPASETEASSASGGVAQQRRQRFRQKGAVLITHWGLSGPATLRLTAFAARVLRDRGYTGTVRVDWTGGCGQQELENRFGQTRMEQSRRQLVNARPWPGLSRRLWLHLLSRNGIDGSLRWADLHRRQQSALIRDLRASHYGVRGRGPFGEEFVTAGGVPLGEVNLATMESRLQKGLHLVGELLDVDGVTGGFNFQHCWCSGWLAGKALASR